MQRILKYFALVITVSVFVVSCDSYPSLQKYYVESQSSADFIALDIPANIVTLKNEDVSEDIRATLKTIKKVNFLGFQVSEDNIDKYTSELQKVKEILKNPKYQDLIRLDSGSKFLTVKFLGTEDAIDEVIFYGADKELGFALVRVLGNKMDPAKMLLLAQEINVDGDSAGIQQIGSFIKNMNNK